MVTSRPHDDDTREEVAERPSGAAVPESPDESGFGQGFARFDREMLLRRDVQVRIAIAIALIVVSLFTNRQYLGWALFAVLGVFIVPFGRAREFLAAAVPYAAVWAVFTFLRSFADETRWARIVNTKAAELERWIFNGELPTIRLQADYYTPGSLQWYDYYFVFIHWSYFIVPHAVAGYLWWKHRELFRQYLWGLAFLLTLGLALYFALPSNPPWMAPEAVNTPGSPTVYRIMGPIGEDLGGGLYQAGYSVIGDSNPIAAMPSIHFAVTFLLVTLAYSFGRRWRWIAWWYALSMGAALVYLGEHYVIDIFAGAAVTVIGWIAAGWWLRGERTIVPSWRRSEDPAPVKQYPSEA